MRDKKFYTSVKLEDSVHKRLKEDKKHFQDTIGGGTWSLNDTVREYQKILNQLKDE